MCVWLGGSQTIDLQVKHSFCLGKDFVFVRSGIWEVEFECDIIKFKNRI